MRALIFALLALFAAYSFADVLKDSERIVECNCAAAQKECEAGINTAIANGVKSGNNPYPLGTPKCVPTSNPVVDGCFIFKKDYRGVWISSYVCTAKERCPPTYIEGTCAAILKSTDPATKKYLDNAAANNGGQILCTDYASPTGKLSCAFIKGGDPPPSPGGSPADQQDPEADCPYDPVTDDFKPIGICHTTIGGQSADYRCCGQNCCNDGTPPHDCPDGWGGGGCPPGSDNCVDVTTDQKGNDGEFQKCYKNDIDPECPKGSCESPGKGGSDDSGGSNPTGDGSNPTGGGGSDPTGGGSNPTGGSPGGVPLSGDTGGGSGGTGGSGSGSGSGTGGKGKDADKDGNCAPGYIPTRDVRNENEMYCRPAGTTEPNSDGNCPDGWEFSKEDSRFCVKKTSNPKECPEGQFYEEGTGCKANDDKCPKGKVQNPDPDDPMECIVQIDAEGSAGPAQPGAITIFDICKQPTKFLSAEVQAQCAIQDDKKKEAQAKKDAEYLQGLVKGVEDFVKSDVQKIAKDAATSLDISKMYSGVFVPFESFFKDSPECPFQQVEIPAINIFGHSLDLSQAFKGENNKLACDVFAAARIIFLLGVYYLGFRLLFKALTGV
jgi:hypothetical protein